jgi:hypothetical protein
VDITSAKVNADLELASEALPATSRHVRVSECDLRANQRIAFNTAYGFGKRRKGTKGSKAFIIRRGNRRTRGQEVHIHCSGRRHVSNRPRCRARSSTTYHERRQEGCEGMRNRRLSIRASYCSEADTQDRLAEGQANRARCGSALGISGAMCRSVPDREGGARNTSLDFNRAKCVARCLAGVVEGHYVRRTRAAVRIPVMYPATASNGNVSVQSHVTVAVRSEKDWPAIAKMPCMHQQAYKAF